MSEMGEFWRDIKEVRQDKRQRNYRQSKDLLAKSGVAFIEKPNGHFIVLNAAGQPTHDFWATTGLIIERGTKRRSRGIRNLIRFAKPKPE